MPERPYDREAAVRYAKRWALGRNPEYASFDSLGGDCTNFASQSVFAGCGVMNFTPDVGWFFQSYRQRSAPWSGVSYFNQFITSNSGSGPFGRNLPLFMAQPGDIVQLELEDGKFDHSVVVIEVNEPVSPETVTVAAHTEDTGGKRMCDYDYKAFRLIHIDGVRQ